LLIVEEPNSDIPADDAHQAEREEQNEQRDDIEVHAALHIVRLMGVAVAFRMSFG
jgi:hypothetical protein